MSETPPTPDPRGPGETPGETPGERRLARPPSDRYAAPSVTAPAEAAPGDRAGPPSAARGVAFGAVMAILGAGAIVLFGGVLAVSAGLLVVAVTIGYAVGLGVVVGSADTLSRPARPWIAAVLAGLGVVLGQVGLWLFARSEGGVLTPLDYLGQTFGLFVPLELLLGATVAWWRAR